MSALKRWLSNRELVVGTLLSILFLAAAAARPVLAPDQAVPPEARGGLSLPEYFRVVREMGRQPLPQPPNEFAPLGTTRNQIDVYYALLWGVGDALRFGLIVAGGAALLGSLVGLLSGYWGGWPNWFLMRMTDGFLTFPLIAGIVLSNLFREYLYMQSSTGRSALDVQGPLFSPPVEFLLSFEFLLILFTWMPYARLVNSLVLRLRSTEFVEAARALGAGGGRIMLRHLMPNSLAPVIVLLSRDIGGVVLLEAALSFTGFGGRSVWGQLLAAGKDYIYGFKGNPLTYWWVFVPTSLAIILFGVAFGLLGDGLNDLLNPHKNGWKNSAREV